MIRHTTPMGSSRWNLRLAGRKNKRKRNRAVYRSAKQELTKPRMPTKSVRARTCSNHGSEFHIDEAPADSSSERKWTRFFQDKWNKSDKLGKLRKGREKNCLNNQRGSGSEMKIIMERDDDLFISIAIAHSLAKKIAIITFFDFQAAHSSVHESA